MKLRDKRHRWAPGSLLAGDPGSMHLGEGHNELELRSMAPWSHSMEPHPPGLYAQHPSDIPFHGSYTAPLLQSSGLETLQDIGRGKFWQLGRRQWELLVPEDRYLGGS